MPDLDVFSEIAGRRYSCRAFDPESLATERIEAILGVAQTAPSWCNVQPWHVDIVSGQALAALSAELLHVQSDGAVGQEYDVDPPGEYTGVFRDRRRESGFALYGSLGIERNDRARRTEQALENLRFFGAPHVAVISCEASLGPYALVDCGSFLTSFLLAATADGVATIAQAGIARYSAVLRSHLGIPENRNVVCSIAFGLADDEHPVNGFRTTRAPADDVVGWFA